MNCHMLSYRNTRSLLIVENPLQKAVLSPATEMVRLGSFLAQLQRFEQSKVNEGVSERACCFYPYRHKRVE